MNMIETIVDKIRDFFYIEETNVYKLHLSHSDMDGLGCTILTRMVMNRSYTRPSIKTLNTADINGASDFIKTYIADILDINPKARFKFLITDIGSIDTTNFTMPGVDYEFILIDHHVINDAKWERLRNANWIGELSIEAPDPKHIYYCNTERSATYSYYYLLSKVQPKSLTWSCKLEEYVTLVSKYDTGKWGSWNKEPFDSAVCEQLLFAYMVKNQSDQAQLNMYIDFIIELYSSMNSVSIENEKDVYIQCEKEELLREYDKFRECVNYTKFNSSIEIPIEPDNIHTPNMRVPVFYFYGMYTIETEADELKYFSLISKRILENNKELDFLCVYEKNKNRVQLRSAKDTVNVAEIALANGGGGHPRAAGFPIHLN